MSFTPVIQPVLVALQSRLADPTIGFNPNFATAAANPIYNLPQEAGVTVDWTPAGPNFSYGMLGGSMAQLIEQLMETANFNFPYFTADIGASALARVDGKSEYGARFSGPVRGTIQCILGWEAQTVTDFASWPNCVIDAMITTINDPLQPMPFGNELGVIYSGSMQTTKTPAVQSGSGWICGITFQFQMEIDVQ